MSKKNTKTNFNVSKEIKDKPQDNNNNSLTVNESQELNDQLNSKLKQNTLEKQHSNLRETLKQTDLFQGSASTLLQNTSYPKDHWVVLESILQRNGLAVKPTKFTLEVLGIYSIPEWWQKLEQSGAIDNWYYQVNIGEAKCINGKMNQRELTEEEKNNLENKKKPPPKVDKKNPDAVKAEEERLKAIQDEKDNMERKFYEELNKLEKINQFYKIKEMPTQADWISFSEEDKKNTVELKNESLIQMEKCINENHEIIIEVNKVPPPDDNEKKRPKPKNMNPEDIKPVYSIGIADLKEFYLVPGKKELILRTPLMLKETYEKRKENNIEPIITPFEPKEDDLKVYLFGPPVQNTEQGKKEQNTDRNEKKEEENESNINEQNDEMDLDYIEKAHTYIYYKLNFSESINPKIPGFGEKLEPVDLIQENTGEIIPSAPEEKIENLSNIEEKDDKLNKSLNIDKEKSIKKILDNDNEKNVLPISKEIKSHVITNERYNILKVDEKKEKDKIEKKEQKEEIEKKISEEEPKPTKSIPANEICSDFRKYIKIFISLICKKYDEITGGELSKNPGAKREKGGTANVKKEERDLNINKFLTKFEEKGEINLIKGKLKKFITRIILEKYKKRTNLSEKFSEQKDKFFSEVYAYICDEIKLGMDEFVQTKKEDIHDHILSSYESSRKELLAYEVRKSKEPEDKRLLRLSKEYEIIDDLDTSMKYYKERITLMQNKDIWNKFSILSKKMGNLIQTEQGIMHCLKIVEQNELNNIQEGKSNYQQKIERINFSILLSSIKYLKGRMKDAIGIITNLINEYSLEKTNYMLNSFLAFLYHESGKNILFIKHYEAAKRFKMIEIGIDLRKPKYNPKIKTTYKNPSLTPEQCDEIWYYLINFLTKNEFCEISEKLLQFISDEAKGSTEFKLAKSKISLFFRRNDEVIQLCDEILSKDDQNYNAWLLRGHAYYFKNNLFDSEESYIKAIKYKIKNTKFDIQMLTRLGIVYIRRKTWSDAKVVFLQILRDSVYHSFAWRYLGLALTNLEEYEAAEEALNEAILLDIENPLTWAYLTMFCIKVKRDEQALACLNELIKMKFNLIDITSEIASLFYKNNKIEIAANLYKRIINLDKTYIDAQVKLAEIYFMKYDESKRKEAIDILKNTLQYANEDEEKKNILQFIQIYENQIDYAKIGEQNSLGSQNINNIDMNVESRVNQDSEFKDNFD